MAARCLEKQGRSLLALSAVLPDQTRGQFREEREYIDEFKTWPNVAIRYVTAEGRGPFDGIEDYSQFVASPLRTSRSYLYREFEQIAFAGGTDVLLEGNMGEVGPTGYGMHRYTELALSLRWPSLFRELRQLRRVHGTRPVRFLAGRFRDLILPLPLPPRLPFVLLTPEFRRNGKARLPFRYSGRTLRGYHEASLRYALQQHATPRSQTMLSRVRMSEPLLDKRVLEFCLAVPSEMFIQNGYNRYLIRGALEGVLPERIRWRTDKAPLSPDYFVRFNSQLEKAKEFVAAIGPSDPVRSVIDVNRLWSMLKPVGPHSRSPSPEISSPERSTQSVSCGNSRSTDPELPQIHTQR